MDTTTINQIIEELCPEFHRAKQANSIERRTTKNEYSTEDSAEGTISDLIINIDKMVFRETDMYRRLNTEFNEAMHSTEIFQELVSKLYGVIASNATDYLLASLVLTDSLMLTDDIYMVQEYDKLGFNPRPLNIVQGRYDIDVQKRGGTYLEVKYSEDGDEIDTVRRRLPSVYKIAVEGFGRWQDKGNKSGERFLHRIVGLALKNKVNDAARRKGYNNCLLVPYEVDGFSLPKTLLVCEHRFNYDVLRAAGYKV